MTIKNFDFSTLNLALNFKERVERLGWTCSHPFKTPLHRGQPNYFSSTISNVWTVTTNYHALD